MELQKIRTDQFLYIDIETVPIKENIEDLEKPELYRWTEWTYNAMTKANEKLIQPISLHMYYKNNASFFPEFSKVVCVTVAYYLHVVGKDIPEFRLMSFAGNDEKNILEEVAKTMKARDLAGHNIMDFDIPFLFKRYLLNSMEVPGPLSLVGKKPWEIKHVDTMAIWKAGVWNGRNISMDDLCFFLGVPSPKADVSGGDVSPLYFQGKIADIASYCEGDVIASANVLKRMKLEKLIPEESIVYLGKAK